MRFSTIWRATVIITITSNFAIYLRTIARTIAIKEVVIINISDAMVILLGDNVWRLLFILQT